MAAKEEEDKKKRLEAGEVEESDGDGDVCLISTVAAVILCLNDVCVLIIYVLLI
jgi:hypothetical protein